MRDAHGVSVVAVRIDVGRRFLVWILAGLAAAEMLLEAVAAALDLDWSDVAVFAPGAGAIFVTAVLVESLKIPAGD